MSNETTIDTLDDPGWDLPKVLRGVGALVLTLSLSSFLFQGWENVTDVTKFLMLLGETVVLTIAGILSIKLLNEPRGARTFVGLTLIAAPINFAILGSMIYEAFKADAGMIDAAPQYFMWQVADSNTAIMLTLGAIAVLIPLIVIGYRIMARQSSKSLATVFIILNAALLIPIRGDLMVNILLLGLTMLTLWQLDRIRNKDFSLKTATGRFARATLYIPLGIIFGRTLWLYGGDIFMTGISSLVAYLILRHFSSIMDKDSAWRPLIGVATFIPGYFAVINICSAVFGYIGFSDAVQIPLTALAFSGVLLDCSLRSKEGVIYQRLAALITVAAAMIGLFTYGTAFNVIWVILTGIASLVVGMSIKQKSAFVLGIITTATGLIFELHSIFNHFDFGSWGAMAAIGITAIVTASIIERHGDVVKSKLSLSYEKFSDWEY